MCCFRSVIVLTVVSNSRVSLCLSSTFVQISLLLFNFVNEMLLLYLAANLRSLELSYVQWIDSCPELAIWLADAPRPFLEILEEEANTFVRRHHPNYSKIHEKIHLRISHLPVEDKIRHIRYLGLICVFLLFARKWKVAGESVCAFFDVV